MIQIHGVVDGIQGAAIVRKSFLIMFLLVLSLVLLSCNQAPDPGSAPAQTSTISEVDLPTSTPTVILEPSPTPTNPSEPASTEPPGNELTSSIEPTPTPSAEATFEEPTPTAVIPVIKADCEDQAIFINDVTVPDGTFFDPGESFTKTWQIQNTGTCTWGDGYALVFAYGDMMSGNLSNPIPSVAPGDKADISVELTAPNRGGPNAGNWLLQDNVGKQFGLGVPSAGYIWVMINVKSQQTGLAPSSDSDSSSKQSQTSPSDSDCEIQQNPGYENDILTRVNQVRLANGLASLNLQSQLSAAAREHSADMACKKFVDHDGSDGSTWYDRVAAQGYANYASSRENIYVGDPAFGGTSQGAFEWWMNSKIHRDNILNPDLDEIGISYVYVPGSPFGGYYTMVLARP